MTQEQALELIQQVCAAFVGNLEQHQNIQAALAIIQVALTDREQVTD